MTNLLALTGRELRSLFYSPIAYVVGALFLFLQGVVFTLLLGLLNDQHVDPHLTLSQFYFGPTFFYTISALIAAPLLTMRAFSEEKRTGSIELLLSAPVTDTQVVLSKFLATWVAYCLLWSCTIVFFIALQGIAPFDWGPVATGYLGTFLLGAVLVSIGLLASSLTRNQIIAAVLSLVVILLLFFIGILDYFVTDEDTREVIQYLSLLSHLDDFSKGIIDTRPVAFYGTATAICLLLTGRIIGSPRWRS
jgi:ABC-2 type transport system permease protein